MKEKTITFKRKIKPSGGSSAITLPSIFLEKIGCQIGSKLEIGLFHGKDGLYIALWKVRRQKSVDKRNTK